ncbi:low molecular weight phosphatase family protein [Haloarchaeobius sp. DFWS5]|uniref:arsenate-mycothiol transferase ArsC n=1 Tax=Haloarchaeobius sp. DFWS5 TaxID=3446114 RepID=UPI003EB8C4FD
MTTLGFVCVQNAGRSQMATAFAEREVARRDLDWNIVTGGTLPADHVHPEVVESMHELDIDVSDRTPLEVTDEALEACDVVATMGCSTLSLDADVDVRDWDLTDPDGKSPEEVAEIRDEIEQRVIDLFDEVASGSR